MGYQSKTYSLSDEVIAAIEAARARGETPSRFLTRMLLTERADVTVVSKSVAKRLDAQKKPSKRERVAQELAESDGASELRVEYDE